MKKLVVYIGIIFCFIISCSKSQQEENKHHGPLYLAGIGGGKGGGIVCINLDSEIVVN